MDSYKVAVVTPAAGNYLDIWTRDGRRVPVFLPLSCADLLRRGMRVMVHRNRAGHAVACSFGDTMILMECPTRPDAIDAFSKGFKDIYEFSLDSIWFKYALRRSLRKIGMMPTGRLVTDILTYNYIHGR
ncbi:MAG: hypothetical protein K2I81_01275 [Alphaproteobacteria bacterium]|nr:hypothetical protein [Alphaproteobacteria bacterium]